MLVNMIDILNHAREGKYAIAQFNINNLEWIRFILEETNELRVPVILGVSEGAAKYMGGYKTVVSLICNLMSYLNISIPVSIHLDHGSSFESCKEAIDAGFTSVMIDASKYDLKKNIDITKSVVDYAKARGSSVEAEVGPVRENNYGIIYADVEECRVFCQKTGIDFLAPALGSVHGPYQGRPSLDFERMVKIASVCGTPLVLHGGSGIPDEDIRRAIDCGICKINLNTELQQVWAQAVRDKLKTDKSFYDPRKIIKAGEKDMKEIIKYKVCLFKTKTCV